MNQNTNKPLLNARELNSKTIFGITLTSSMINRICTNFLELTNTRVLKNVGLTHLQHKESFQLKQTELKINSAPRARNTRILKSIQSIYNREGLKGYFRGLSSGMGLSLVRASTFFPFYEHCKF